MGGQGDKGEESILRLGMLLRLGGKYQLPTTTSAKAPLAIMNKGHNQVLQDLKTNQSIPRRVTINGDDFGFSPGVNEAIIRAHEQGVLTSTSLMVTGEAAAEAIALAKNHPNLAVGLHLVLVCGRSVLSPPEIPNLVDGSGNFANDSLQAGLRYQFNRSARQELRREIRAQLEQFRSSGLPLSHVDGHLHLHVHPVVLRYLVELAEEFQIKAIRLPAEELGMTLKLDRRNLLTKLVWWGVFSGLRRYGVGLLKQKGIRTTQRVYGLLQSGSMTKDYLLGLIPQITADWIEIYAHPAIALAGEPLNGPPGSGAAELEALLSPQVHQALVESNFELTNYPNSLVNDYFENSC